MEDVIAKHHDPEAEHLDMDADDLRPVDPEVTFVGLAQKVWRQCVLVFAHDLGLRGGNCKDLLATTGLFSFHW